MINKSKNVCLKNVIQKGKKHEKINRNQLQKYFKTSGLSNYKKKHTKSEEYTNYKTILSPGWNIK